MLEHNNDLMNISQIGNASLDSVSQANVIDDDGRLEFLNKIDPHKWCGLFRGYIRKDYTVDELRASWVELFYDLIFVACIVHLAYEGVHSLPNPFSSDSETHRRLLATPNDDSYSSNCGEYDYLLTIFTQFGLFNIFWTEQVMYTTHFIFTQIGDEILRVIYMMMVLSMGVFIGNYPSYHMAFIVSYAILRFFSLFMYLKALLIPRAKWHATWHLILYFIIFNILLYLIICMHLSLIYSACSMAYFVLYCILFIIEYLGRMARLILAGNTLTPNIKLSMNIPHIAERFGLFVMIILGESLISLMTAEIGELDLTEGVFEWKGDGTPPDVMQIFCILLTFILSYLIGRLYYNSQPTEEKIMENPENHALGRQDKIYTRLYQFAHQILFFGLFGYGVGVKIVAFHLLDNKRRWIDVLLSGYSLVVIVICLYIIRIAHPFEGKQHYEASYKNIWIQRIIILCVMMVIPLGGMLVNQGVLFGIMFICVVMLVIIDIEGQHKVKEEKKEAKEKREEISSPHPISLLNLINQEEKSPLNLNIEKQ